MKIKFEGKSNVGYLTSGKEYEVYEHHTHEQFDTLYYIMDDDGEYTAVGRVGSSLIEGNWIIVNDDELGMTKFKVGDKVKVVRKFEGGVYPYDWVEEMDDTLHKIGVVRIDNRQSRYVRVFFEELMVTWWYDITSLEIVSEETPSFSDTPVVNTTQIKDTNPKDLIGSKKAKLSVIPAGVMFEVGLGLLEGACKYGRHNYRGAGVRSSVYYDATLGHLMDWWEGQDIDDESGLSHVTKALSSLVVLRDAMLQGMLTDDRPPRSKVFKSDFNDKASAIIDLHSDKNPRHYTIKDSI